MKPRHACTLDGGDRDAAALASADLAVFAYTKSDTHAQDTARRGGASPPASVALRQAGRRRLWEIAPVHHCVLLGAAFDARELRQMFRCTHYAGWETSTDYELHSSAVSLAAQANEFSRRAQRKLDARYEAAIAAFRAADAAPALLSIWALWVERGELVAAYWAATTHPACDLPASETLSKEMHMFAHTAFIGNRAAGRRIRALHDTNADLASQVARLQAQCRGLRTEAARLRAETQAGRADARKAQGVAADALAALERWRCGKEIAQWHGRCEALVAARSAALAQAAAERRNVAKLMARIEWLEQRSMRIAAGSLQADAPASSADETPEDTPQVPDLADACVLCVGGRASLVPKYRSLIERARGDFLYHDGGVEDHLGRLPALLSSAHAVICFSGEVSHAAYRTVKRYCKVRGKPCALIQQSSVNAALRALATIRNLLPSKTEYPSVD